MATEIVAKIDKQYGLMGVLPQIAVKIEGCVGVNASGAPVLANYVESPFKEDMVIVEAYMDIKTPAGGAAQQDIGTADDAANTGANNEIFVDPANNVAAILSGLAVGSVAGRACPVWKAKDSADQSFITSIFNTVDASAMKFNLILVCTPKAALD